MDMSMCVFTGVPDSVMDVTQELSPSFSAV